MAVVLFILLVAAAGLGGFAVLARLGLDEFEAWAGGRAMGLVVVAMPAWWLGVAGLHQWRIAGAVVLVLSALLGAVELWRRRPWRAVAAAEAVFLVGTAIVLFIRLDHPEITGTEKPMDFGILATLLRAEGFPPPDMWLAGEALPYYYWGALLWTVPKALSALPLETAYNVIVALLGGMAAAALWALGRRLGGGHGSGLVAAFFGAFAGTPDAVRQLLGGTSLTGIDFWHSSRQIEDTITEFPLFTLWLGDLHPHLLSLPVAVLALLVAVEAGRRGPQPGQIFALAVLFGVTWAANPWAMPPTLVGVALLLMSSPERFFWPTKEGRRRWIAVAVIAFAGWLLTAPFHLAFQPFFTGVKRVFSWTPPAELLLYGGVLLVPTAAAAVGLVRRWIDGREEVRRSVLLMAGGAVLALAAATGRPTLVMTVVVFLVFVVAVVLPATSRHRPALAIAALGVFLFFVPEVLYVEDGYGDALHRMNTIFKAYIQGWILLAAALPVVLRIGFPERAWRTVLLVLMVVSALPHLVSMSALTMVNGRPGLDGLRWMPADDRAVVRFLRNQAPGTVIVEAVGGAYTDYGRFAAASGVPTLLGWENHEMVWRGNEILSDTAVRKSAVAQIYGSGDQAMIRRLVADHGIDLVVIGSFERRDFSAASLAEVARAGRVVLEDGDAVVVAFPGMMGP
jgi:YYY domain-containing protein